MIETVTFDSVVEELENSPSLLSDNWCVPRETGRFLHVMALATKAKRICEIGTSIGYSTLWLSRAANQNGGTVDTLEYFASRQDQAIQNVARAGYGDIVTFHLGQAAETLSEFQFQGQNFDFAFIDADKKGYIEYAKSLESLLVPGAILVADNTRSHRDEMQDFLSYMSNSSAFDICELETPSGQLVARKK